jgi:hypothetical protein
MVRQMLIRRSQLHPVTMAAAAGGKMMATCSASVFLCQNKTIDYQVRRTHKDEADVRSSERHYGFREQEQS